MADFAHLQSKRKDTAEYRLYNVVGEPTLIVRPAGETNKPYYNEMLRKMEQLQRRKAKINVDLLREYRDRDRELYPKYVVVSWRDVKDAKGTDVVFSKEECEAFLRALEDDEVDDLRNFCRDASNFREQMDSTAIAGNSQTV